MSTLHQVFSRLDRDAFEKALGKWLQERGLQDGEAVAIDGKRWRGLHGRQLPGAHLVAAYAQQSGIVVGQQAVGEKQNELDAIPGLLENWIWRVERLPVMPSLPNGRCANRS